MTATMPGEIAHDATLSRARAQGRRLAHGFIIAVSLVFIGASVVQIVAAVFGLGVAPQSKHDPCSLGVQILARELADSLTGLDFPPATKAEEAVAQACASSQNLDTWAAIERLRVAQEQLVRRNRMELAPLESDVAAHLPTDLR